MATKIKLSKSAQARMEREARKKCKELAKETKDRLEEKYNEIIDTFYAEYPNPSEYVRNVYRGGTPGLEKTYRTKFGRTAISFEGGIIISTDDMYEGGLRGKEIYTFAGYEGTQEQVLFSFLSGYHGLPPFSAPRKLNTQFSIAPITEAQYGNGVHPLKEMRKFYNDLIEEMKTRIHED